MLCYSSQMTPLPNSGPKLSSPSAILIRKCPWPGEQAYPRLQPLPVWGLHMGVQNLGPWPPMFISEGLFLLQSSLQLLCGSVLSLTHPASPTVTSPVNLLLITPSCLTLFPEKANFAQERRHLETSVVKIAKGSEGMLEGHTPCISHPGA